MVPIVILLLVLLLQVPASAKSDSAEIERLLEESQRSLIAVAELEKHAGDARVRQRLVTLLGNSNRAVSAVARKAVESIIRGALRPQMVSDLSAVSPESPQLGHALSILAAVEAAEGMTLFQRALDSPTPRVRALALLVFNERWRWEPEKVPLEVRQRGISLLMDEALDVRKAAVQVASGDDHETWVAALLRRSFLEPDDDLRKTIDSVLQDHMGVREAWRPSTRPAGTRVGVLTVVSALKRELVALLTLLLLWFGLARRIPPRLDGARISGLHRLVVPAVPLGLLAAVISMVFRKPWLPELFRRGDVPAAIGTVVVGGLGLGALVVWASRRPEPPAEPVDPDEPAADLAGEEDETDEG